MATNFSNAEVKQWSNEAHQVFRQQKSLLRDAVRVVKGVEGKTYGFHKISGGTVINNKTPHADLTSAGLDHGIVNATLTTCHAPEYIDDLSQFTTNLDVRKDYFAALTCAVNVELDTRIVTAMNGTSNTVTMPTTGTFNAAAVAAITKAMNNNSVPYGDRFMFIPASALEDLQGDNKLASRDYVASQALEKGFVDNVSGFRMIVAENQSILPVGTGTKFGYAFHKSAVGLAMGADLTAAITMIDLKDSWQVLVKMLAGAALVDGTGVFKFEITD